ncbi:MAG: hypothetical protein NZ480_06850 [Bdellovibrionaceae bacterium]|nr:hypothetical protein [Pseudobdellovibrionaceae bacterium]MDW8190312.1 hypothetical protein [Pseudobdellovibrionaceae bacterium]
MVTFNDLGPSHYKESPSAQEIISSAFKLMMEHFPWVLATGLLYLVISFVLGYLGILNAILTTPVSMGFIRLTRDIVKNNEFNSSSLFWFFLDFKRFFRSVGLGIVLPVLFLIGLIFFVIPGVIVFLDYFWSVPFMALDDSLSIGASLKKSKQLTQSIGRWFTVKYLMMFVLVASLGVILTLGLGLLIVIPFSFLTILKVMETFEGKSTNPSLISIRG